MLNIHHIMFSDDTGIDNMNNQCENPAEFRSCWVTKYVKKIRSLIQALCDFPYRCLSLSNIIYVDHNMWKNATIRDKIGCCTEMHQPRICKLNFFRSAVVDCFSRTKNRWNTRVERKAELESWYQMCNKRSSRQVYMQISILIKNSWACAVNCAIVMTVRVCWNQSSTAILEGVGNIDNQMIQ